jgi:serine protease Do
MKKVLIIIVALILGIQNVHPIALAATDESQPQITNEATQTALQKIIPATVSIMGRNAPLPDSESTYSVTTIGNTTITFKHHAPNLIRSTNITYGSGFIVSHNGYIITNKHVVSDVDAQYAVLLYNGSQQNAIVVYRDPVEDIALLKIDGTFPNITSLTRSSPLTFGQSVIAIGNAYGRYPNTYSLGTVTGLSTNVIANGENLTEQLNDVLETSTTIYPGFSGGPLVDLDGNVIGINVAHTENVDNLSFSIPTRNISNIIQNYIGQ